MPQKPPRPPPRAGTGLDEVERALSTLAGRHPEHERVRRETMAAAEKRRRTLEKEGAENARRRRRRALVVAANVVAFGAAAWVGLGLYTRSRALQEGLEEAEKPWRALGFEALATNVVTAERVLKADLAPEACFVALSTRRTTLTVRIGATLLESAGARPWCACAGAAAVVEAPSAGPAVGLAVLRVDAHAGGGPMAQAWSNLPTAEWIDGGRACAEDLLDTWIGAGGWRRPNATDGSPDEGAVDGALKRAGFLAVSTIETSRPFGVVEGAAEQCWIAMAGAADSLSLRTTGGQRPVQGAHGAIAWCSKAPRTVTVWRDGSSRGEVFAAPAARVGGLLGSREAGEVVGLHFDAGASWESDDDLAWDAGALLRASGMADVVQRDLGERAADPIGPIVALSLSTGAALARPPDAVVACDPPLQLRGLGRSLCASAEPVAWWRTSAGPASEAHAPLPVWLSALQARREPDAIARIPELVGLARRLLREGFEPTLLEGVTEMQDGVRIVGRADEDAVVAVGVAPKAPWTFPYTDSVPWDLGDAPRVVSLEPGDSVKLVATPAPSVPLEKRRTVVFRHVSHH